MKRLLILGIILSAVAAVTFPLLAQGDLPPTVPIIHAELNGQSFASFPGSSCWIKADDAPLCDFVEQPDLTDSIAVTVGDVVVFVIDPAQPPPTSFSASLPDKPAADGSIPTRDLASTNGEFVTEGLDLGEIRVEVVATYAAPGGGEYFVSGWFLLQVNAATALTTPEATVEPTPTEIISTPTLVATPEVTVEATSEVTVPATIEATAEVTSVPTAEATSAAVTVEPTFEATAEATLEPTDAATVEATAESTLEPTPEVTAEVTAESTAETTVEATVEATVAAAGTTPTVPVVVTEAATEVATLEPTLLTPEATVETTLEATAAVTETPLPPSSTPTLVPPTTAPILPTNTPPIEIILATATPAMVLIGIVPTVGLDSQTGDLLFAINAPEQDLIQKCRVEVLDTLTNTSVFVSEVLSVPLDSVRVPLAVLTGGRYVLRITGLGADGAPVSNVATLEFNYTPPTAVPSPSPTLPPPTPTLFVPTVGPAGGEATATPVSPTEAPTIQPVVATPTATPEILIVTATPVTVGVEATPTLFIPTIAPTSGIPSAPPQISAAEVPAARINAGGVESEPFAVRACVTNAAGEPDCGGGPIDTAPSRVAAPAGSLATFTFAGITPSAVVINLFTPDGITLQRSDQLALGEVIAYAIPTLRGTYLLSVEVTWAGGTATYYFRLSVN